MEPALCTKAPPAEIEKGILQTNITGTFHWKTPELNNLKGCSYTFGHAV